MTTQTNCPLNMPGKDVISGGLGSLHHGGLELPMKNLNIFVQVV